MYAVKREILLIVYESEEFPFRKLKTYPLKLGKVWTEFY